MEKDNVKLTLLINCLNTLHQTSNLKRGLINVMGFVSKTLFDTMDAEDASLINEHIKLLQDRQLTIQHVTKNQIKVPNATIGQIKNLEETLVYNENLLSNVMSRIQQQITKIIHPEDMDKHLLILNIIMTDLTNDVEYIIDFMTYTTDRIILTSDYRILYDV